MSHDQQARHLGQTLELEERAVAALSVALEMKHQDPHTFVASKIFDIKESAVTEQQRQMVKRLTYKSLYSLQPPQCKVFEDWTNNRSGEHYTAVIRGRHRRTLEPMVAYLDRQGMAWFGDVEEFEGKFTRHDPAATVNLVTADAAQLEILLSQQGEKNGTSD